MQERSVTIEKQSQMIEQLNEENKRQDDLIEQLNKKMMSCDVAEDDAVINGGST